MNNKMMKLTRGYFAPVEQLKNDINGVARFETSLYKYMNGEFYDMTHLAKGVKKNNKITIKCYRFNLEKELNDIIDLLEETQSKKMNNL